MESRRSDGIWAPVIERLDVRRGDHVAIIGPCDSGKTATALFATGVAEPGFARGTAFFEGRLLRETNPQIRARAVGLVSGSAALSFSGIRDTLRGELELHLQVLGYDKSHAPSIERVSEELRLDPLLARDPFTLSGGEQIRAALALSLLSEPMILITDDIFTGLDRENARQIETLLQALSVKGTGVVELHARAPSWIHRFSECIFLSRTENVQGPYSEVFSQVLAEAPELLPETTRRRQTISRGRGCAVPPPVDVSGLDTERPRARSPIVTSGKLEFTCGSPDLALSAADWFFRYPDGAFEMGPINLDLRRGEASALVGANGSGKTTLLKTLGLLLCAQRGSLSLRAVDGAVLTPPDTAHGYLWPRHVLYSFQDPDDQLFLPTVGEELEATARFTKKHDPASRARSAAEWLGLENLLERSPPDLPRPQRRLVALGSCLAAAPDVLLLDEPTVSLDSRQRDAVVCGLGEYIRNGGTILMVSHDLEFISDTCSLIYVVRSGRLLGASDPANVWEAKW